MKKQQINEKVIVTAFGFRSNLSAYPKRIEYKGLTYRFIDAGLRCLVSSGGAIAEILTLSDGVHDYHLKTENRGLIWTLVKIA